MHPSAPAGQQTIDLSLSVGRACFQMLVIMLPLLAALSWLFAVIRGGPALLVGLIQFTDLKSLLPAALLGIVFHELIHGITWIVLGRCSPADVKLGFQWQTLTPYAHLQVPITARAYRWGALMPALSLGLLPYLIGLATGRAWFAVFGLLFVLAAGGDILILVMLRHVAREAMVRDHPTRAGCYVLPSVGGTDRGQVDVNRC